MVVWKSSRSLVLNLVGQYNIDGLTIKTLPGVFSRDGLDVGSQLLLSTLTPHTKGKVLDVGCGAGVLSAALASHSPKVRLTLCDVSAPAVEASRATLAANGLEGEVFASNVFSEVKGRFDAIISTRRSTTECKPASMRRKRSFAAQCAI